MKILAAVLAFLMVAQPAMAVTPRYNRVALIWHRFNDDFGSGFNRLRHRQANVMRALRDSGIPFDVIAAQDTAAYFARGVDDSAAFRLRYDAIIIPAVAAMSNTANNPANKVHLGFRPSTTDQTTLNSVAVNAPHSPFSGRWKVKVFAWQFDVINNTTVSFVNGCSLTAGNASLSSQMQMPTGACPMAEEGAGDTIFVNSRNVLRDMDTPGVTVYMSGVNSFTHKPTAAADSITYWLYDPDGDGIGVHWLNMREYDPNGNTTPIMWTYSDAILIGQMCQATGIVPPNPYVGWFDIDHVHPQRGITTRTGRDAVYNVRDFKAYSDSLRNWKMVMAGPVQSSALMGNATLETDNAGYGFVQDEVKQIAKDYEDVWSMAVHDHFNATPWVWRSTLLDTATAKTQFLTAVSNAQGSMWKSLKNFYAAGSFGFSQTLPQDDGDWRVLKVYGDAGVKVIRGSGGFHQEIPATETRLGRLMLDPFSLPMPSRAPGTDSKIVWVSGGTSLLPPNTRTIEEFTAGNYSGSIVGWMNNAFPIWFARGATYWHGSDNMEGLSTNPTAWSPAILYMKHVKNMLKLTHPFVQKQNQYTAIYRTSRNNGN